MLKLFSLLDFDFLYILKSKKQSHYTVKMLKNRHITLGLAAITALFSTVPALAGQPESWGLMLQQPASPSAERIGDFHHMLLYIIAAIVLFVLALLIFVVLRYNRRANPNPSQTTHNVLLEVIWTVVPVVILIIIAIPSFKLLYYTNRVENPEMTLKVTGYQWYWGYEYPDNGGVNFMAYMIPDSEIKPEEGQVRLLSTDNPIVLPVGKNIQIDITAGDVLHSWAVPALGIKTDSVPGRTNSTWVRINEPGVYFGQCSELCGKDHAYMPIEIHAVSLEEFNAWAVEKGGQPLVEKTDETAATEAIESGDETVAAEGEVTESAEPAEGEAATETQETSSESVAAPDPAEIKDHTEESVQDAPASEGEE